MVLLGMVVTTIHSHQRPSSVMFLDSRFSDSSILPHELISLRKNSKTNIFLDILLKHVFNCSSNTCLMKLKCEFYILKKLKISTSEYSTLWAYLRIHFTIFQPTKKMKSFRLSYHEAHARLRDYCWLAFEIQIQLYFSNQRWRNFKNSKFHNTLTPASKYCFALLRLKLPFLSFSSGCIVCLLKKSLRRIICCPYLRQK